MSMDFIYKKEDMQKAKISSRSKLSMITYVFDRLDDHHKNLFKESCFSNFLELRNAKIAYQIIHQIMIRQVKTAKQTNEAWFKFNGKLARFGLEEFTIVTGLNPSELEDEIIEEGESSYLLETYFRKNKGKINRKELLKVFDKCNNQEDKYKLGLLVCLVWVLLGAEERTLLSLWLFHVVEDLDKFNSYPWGKKSFLHTMKNFWRKWDDNNKKKELNKRKEYSLQGFPFAIMVWALEIIPALGESFAKSCGKRVPRMLSWQVDDQLRSQDLVRFLESRKHKVKGTLEPTEAEKCAVFWQQMAHSNDMEDARDALYDDARSASMGGSTGDNDDDGADNAPEKEPSDCEERSHHVAHGPYSDIATFVAQVVDKKLEDFKNSVLTPMEHKIETLDRKLDKLISLLTTNQDKPPIQEVEIDDDQEKLAENVRQNLNTNSTDVGKVGRWSSKSRGENDAHNQDIKKDCGNEEVVEKRSQNSEEGSADELECEQPLGRGQRKRKPAPYLKTPYTDPSKRRKWANVSEFDPFRVVDKTKVDDLNRMLSNAKSSDVVPTALCEVKKKFFDDLMKEGWLTDIHVDLALYHIRERAVQYPNLFQQDSCIVDTFFVRFVKSAYARIPNSSKGKKLEQKLQHMSEKELNEILDRSLVRYVEGLSPMLSKPWSGCRFLYAPCCISDHWIALKIDLQERIIELYDSLPGHLRRVELLDFIRPLTIIIPWLIHTKVDKKYETKMFSYSKETCPGQHNGSDCGMFALKVIEFLHVGKDISFICQNYIADWRKKLAAEIFAQYFDP